MELYWGRPENVDGRQEKEIRTYNFLDSLNVTYARTDHEPAMTMEACAAIDITLAATMCKNLLLCNRQCTNFYLLMLPNNKPFKTKELSAQIGSSRLSFADGKYMEEFLDITPGSLSVLGLMNDKNNHVQLLIDKDLLSDDYICCHPCINTSSVRIAKDEMINTVIPALGHTPVYVDLKD